MRSFKRFRRVPVVFLAVMMLGSGVASAAPEATSSRPDLQRAQSIRRTLAAGRTAEAVSDADVAIKKFPKSAAVRRLRGESQLCRAIVLGGEFNSICDQAPLVTALEKTLKWFSEGGATAPLGNNADSRRETAARAMLEQLDRAANSPSVQHYLESVRAQISGGEALLDRRAEALAAAFSDFREARRLGDSSTELELSELWGRVILLFWRQELQDLQRQEAATISQLQAMIARQEKPLAAYQEISTSSILRLAGELAVERSTDPIALAGAADVLAVVGDIQRTPDPLRTVTLPLLNHRFLKNSAQFVPQASATARSALTQQYRQILENDDLDPVLAPHALALRLYRQALEVDKKWQLPLLRVRLYLLELPFDPDRANDLLTQLYLHEPQNAVVAMERARKEFLLDENPESGMSQLRKAGRLLGFSRSYLVGLPEGLRSAMRYVRPLQLIASKGWPGYEWMFATLDDLQHAQPKGGGGETELRLLQLKLAERLIDAPDYTDQSLGIQNRLVQLEALLDFNQLPPEQRILLQSTYSEYTRKFADFPVTRRGLTLTPTGLHFFEYPQVRPDSTRTSSRLVILPNGNRLLFPPANFKLPLAPKN